MGKINFKKSFHDGLERSGEDEKRNSIKAIHFNVNLHKCKRCLKLLV